MDSIRPSDRSPILGALADLVKKGADFADKPFGYPNPPVKLISELLGVPALGRTLDRASYGQPLTNSGKANVPLIPDDTMDSAFLAAPILYSGAKLGKAAVPALAESMGARRMAMPSGYQSGALGDVPKLTVSGEPTLHEFRLGQKNTMKSLEALPNTSRIPKQALLEQSFRKDLSAPELSALKNIVGDTEGKYISPPDLYRKFRMETGNAHLDRNPTDQYADYGLDRLGINNSSALNSTTNKYNFENPHGVDTNHFSDPYNFGHTRTFDEDGVRHVVEVQSDYSQLKPSERPVMSWEDIRKLADDPRVASNEFGRKTAESVQREVAAPLTKIASRRLADEEIANAMRNPPRIPDILNPKRIEAENKQDKLFRDWRDYDNLYDEELRMYGANHPNTIRASEHRDQLRRDYITSSEAGSEHPTWLKNDASPAKAIRFATPDTVAKVEGWQRTPARTKTKTDLEQELRDEIQEWGDGNSRTRMLKEAIAQYEVPRTSFVDPGHNTLFRKYEKELMPHLEKLGGKLYTDPKGNTWIQVPLNDNSGRVQLYSAGPAGLVAGEIINAPPSND